MDHQTVQRVPVALWTRVANPGASSYDGAPRSCSGGDAENGKAAGTTVKRERSLLGRNGVAVKRPWTCAANAARFAKVVVRASAQRGDAAVCAMPLPLVRRDQRQAARYASSSRRREAFRSTSLSSRTRPGGRIACARRTGLRVCTRSWRSPPCRRRSAMVERGKRKNDQGSEQEEFTRATR
jgi:hypothetical protein